MLGNSLRKLKKNKIKSWKILFVCKEIVLQISCAFYYITGSQKHTQLMAKISLEYMLLIKLSIIHFFLTKKKKKTDRPVQPVSIPVQIPLKIIWLANWW